VHPPRCRSTSPRPTRARSGRRPPVRDVECPDPAGYLPDRNMQSPDERMRWNFVALRGPKGHGNDVGVGGPPRGMDDEPRSHPLIISPTSPFYRRWGPRSTYTGSAPGSRTRVVFTPVVVPPHLIAMGSIINHYEGTVHEKLTKGSARTGQPNETMHTCEWPHPFA
jgi:hypothetical protein